MDKGANRENNDKAFKSRRQFFKTYCLQLGIQCPSLRFLNTSDREGVLVAYAIDVAAGKNIKQLPHLKHTTIKEYLKAAASFATEQNLPDPRYRYNKYGVRHSSKMFPELSQWNNFLAKWESAPNKAWSLDMKILSALETTRRTADPLSVTACTIDAIILGSHTGSRCAEYARGTLRPGESFSTLPNNYWLREWAGLPIALIYSDFTFMTKDRLVIAFQEAKTQAIYVTIRFRFDKAGGQNFNLRTFRSIPTQPFLCPVNTSIRLLERWNQLGANINFPICCYKPLAHKKKRKHPQSVISDRDVPFHLR